MKISLTPRLLGFLIKKGYKYFLSQTTRVDLENAQISINLKPVKKHPLLQKLPHPFSAYCSLIQEPIQMALGIENTAVTVDLLRSDAKKFNDFNKYH